MSSELAITSSIAFWPAAVLLWRRGGTAHAYWPEVALVLAASGASAVYHACATPSSADVAWCPESGSEAVALARDMMAAYLSLLVAVTPLLRQWVGEAARARYGLAMALVTYVVVVLLQDSVGALAVLGGLHAMALAAVVWARGAAALKRWERARLSALAWALAFALVAVTARMASRDAYTEGAQSNRYYWMHALWHLAGAVATFLYVWTLDEARPGPGPLAYAPVNAAPPIPIAPVASSY